MFEDEATKNEATKELALIGLGFTFRVESPRRV
jgi:hypothetical protein